MFSALEWIGSSVLGGSPQTGAIDIIMIRRQSNPGLVSSPWHVKVANGDKGQIIRVVINGFDSGLRMKVGDAGEAFFVEKTRHGKVVKNLASEPTDLSLV